MCFHGYRGYAYWKERLALYIHERIEARYQRTRLRLAKEMNDALLNFSSQGSNDTNDT